MTVEEEWEALSALERPQLPESANGVDLAMLADDTAECLSAFFMTGSLDAAGAGTLRACESELRAVLPALSGAAATYFARLGGIASTALQRVGRHGTDFLR